MVPADRQPDGGVDQAHHAVGLYEVAPLFNVLPVNVFGQPALAVAVGPQFLRLAWRINQPRLVGDAGRAITGDTRTHDGEGMQARAAAQLLSDRHPTGRGSA